MFIHLIVIKELQLLSVLFLILNWDLLAMYRSQATMVAPIWNPSCFEDSKRGQAITRELKTLQTKSKCGGRYAAEDIKTNSAV